MLIKCPECQKKISVVADFCPNCGYSDKDGQYKKRIRFALICSLESKTSK